MWDRPERNRLLGELTAAVRDADVEVRGGLPDGPDPYRLSTRRRWRRCSAPAGATETGARSLVLVHEATGVDELWDGLLGGTARISTVLAGLPEATRARVRAAFAERVAPAGGAVALEAAVTIGCATFA